MNGKRVRKILSMALVVLMSFSSMAFAATGTKDYEGHWASASIQNWVDKGYVKGYKDGTFRPENDITRTEFISIVNRVFEFTEEAEVKFTDVDASHWAYNEFKRVSAKGYMVGHPDGTFGHKDKITRAEVASVLATLFKLNVAKDSEAYLDLADLKEVEKQDWATGSVSAIVDNGYMKLREGNIFAPRALATRAEVVDALSRGYLDNDEKEESKPSTPSTGGGGGGGSTPIVRPQPDPGPEPEPEPKPDPKPDPAVNKTELNVAIAAAAKEVEANYTEASWSVLTKALALPEVTQVEVNAKTAAINDAIAKLEIKPVAPKEVSFDVEVVQSTPLVGYTLVGVELKNLPVGKTAEDYEVTIDNNPTKFRNGKFAASVKRVLTEEEARVLVKVTLKEQEQEPEPELLPTYTVEVVKSTPLVGYTMVGVQLENLPAGKTVEDYEVTIDNNPTKYRSGKFAASVKRVLTEEEARVLVKVELKNN